MYRRVTALAVRALAGCPGVAAAKTELNVIPHGQTQPGAAWTTLPGMLPADAQARMYDRLTPFGANVTDAMLQPEPRRQRLLQVRRAQAGRRPLVHHGRHDRRDGRRAHAQRADPPGRVRRAERLLGH